MSTEDLSSFSSFSLFFPPDGASTSTEEGPDASPGANQTMAWLDPQGRMEAPAASGQAHPETNQRQKILEQQAGQAENSITILVQALGPQSGSYRVAYQKGMTLQRYLARCKLTKLASDNRLYDESNMQQGRIRMYYVPTSNSRIIIVHSEASPIRQRTSTDAEAKAHLSEVPRADAPTAPAPTAALSTPETDELGLFSI